MLGYWQHELRHFGERYWYWLRRQPGYWLRLLPRAIKATFNENTSLYAASLGYYTFISLFPLLLLSVALGSLWFDPLWAEGKITSQLDLVAPGLSEMLGQNLESIVNARGPISGLALILLMWAASNIFNVLVHSMDNVWGLEKGRNGWQRRGIALLMVMIFSALLLIGSTVEGFVVTIVNSLLPEELQQLRPYTNQLWAAFVSILLFAVLYRVLPHKKLTWRDVLPGAVVAALVWELLKRAFLMFIDVYLSRSNLVYGSVTTIIAFLTWTWASGIIFLFGAHLNVVYYKSRQKMREEIGDRP
ncbi:MAG TPA: YihY/virulence factor BrkB family protein [Anaerolineae bacterium]|nr:YihY/virulence factor BrkB family protein [Anaerolineae bacterium]HIP73032.1 YihY/virulence factor BrkB family protein [Anaerolineae bacterium]